MRIVSETRRVEGDIIIIDRVIEMDQALKFVRFNFMECESEDKHDFDSTGQCKKCGSHRRSVEGRW